MLENPVLVAGMLPNWHRGWFYQKHGQITLEVLKILSQRSGEMAQHNNTATPDGLSLVPRTHMMGGQNHFLSYPLIYTYVRHGFTLLFQNSNKGFKKRCIPNLHRAKQTGFIAWDKWQLSLSGEERYPAQGQACRGGHIPEKATAHLSLTALTLIICSSSFVSSHKNRETDKMKWIGRGRVRQSNRWKK